MRAAITQGTATPLAVVELADPEPAAGEVLVRVSACGICGSDLHLSDAVDAPGIVLGHEFCGEIVAVGDGVEPARIGELVAAFPLAGCGHCSYCVQGHTSKCASAAQLGLQRPGAFAELTTVPASSAFRLPTSIDRTRGALVEPLAVAHHALEVTPRADGESILVIGAGPVGVAVAHWARALGARHVIVTDPVPDRRALAERVGATASIDPNAEDVAGAYNRIVGGLPSVVIECVGVPGMIQHAMDVAGTDARVTIVGVCIPPDQLTPLTALQKELAIQFVLYYAKSDFTVTIDALDRELLDPDALVTATIGLAELPARFDALKHPTTDCKVIVQP